MLLNSDFQLKLTPIADRTRRGRAVEKAQHSFYYYFLEIGDCWLIGQKGDLGVNLMDE